jgi:uncharacterized protein YecE (DUF72 family)
MRRHCDFLRLAGCRYNDRGELSHQREGQMLYIGTCGWSYEDWKSVVYAAAGRVDPLSYMARYFDALEINVSFYRDVPAAMAASWLRRLEPFPDLRFTAKLHQRFTHQREGPLEPAEFRESLAGLEPLLEAGRLAALLAQFPWSFRDEPQQREWLQSLAACCERCRLVVELRHDSWLSAEAIEFLRALGVGFCNIDQPRLNHCIPPTELVFSPIAYVRLHGRNHARWFDHDEAHERYDYLYTERELDEWVPRIRRIAEQAETTFVFTNNHYRGQAPANALELKAKLSGQPVEVPALLLDSFPELAKIALPADEQRQRRLF